MSDGHRATESLLAQAEDANNALQHHAANLDAQVAEAEEQLQSLADGAERERQALLSVHSSQTLATQDEIKQLRDQMGTLSEETAQQREELASARQELQASRDEASALRERLASSIEAGKSQDQGQMKHVKMAPSALPGDLKQRFLGLRLSRDPPHAVEEVDDLTDEKGVVQGSPGYANAPLHRGDILLSIDGRDTSHMTPADVHSLLKGDLRTTVQLILGRGKDRMHVKVMRHRFHEIDAQEKDADAQETDAHAMQRDVGVESVEDHDSPDARDRCWCSFVPLSSSGPIWLETCAAQPSTVLN